MAARWVKRSTIAGLFILAAEAIGLTGAEGQGAGNTPNGTVALTALTFTDTQARRGQAIFGSSCARCHGVELAGQDGPPLIGDNFTQKWVGKTAAEFVARISATMPADAPGTLQAGQYLNLLAFIAQQNGTPAGDVALPADEATLATMSFLPLAAAE